MQLLKGHPVQFRPDSKHKLVGPDCPNAARVLLMHTSACMAALAVLLHPSPCQAMPSIDVETVQHRQARRQQLHLQAPTQTMGVREQVAALQQLTKEATASEDAGDFSKEAYRLYTMPQRCELMFGQLHRLKSPQMQALELTTRIVDDFPDLAITNYARIRRALLLHQTGQTREAILELEGLESSLRGSAEVHTALAAVLYADNHSKLPRAETQFDLGADFDKRYSDLNWVDREKHWPPRMLEALQRFLKLD